MTEFWTDTLILSIFAIGYLAIILEFYVKVNKTAVGLFLAVVCWMFYFLGDLKPLTENLADLSRHLSDISQIIFFLLGAMTLVELIDSHKGFNTVARLIHTTSKRRMLWVISILAFCLSAVLDNLTTTILMISILRKLIPQRKERFLLSCMIIIAANAGGAWTPIGDVTTTMLWINGQVSSLMVMKEVFVPSVISLLVPLFYFTYKMKDGDEDTFYVYCCYFILGSYYGYPVQGGGAMKVEIFNKDQGLMRTYKMGINADLTEFTPTAQAVDIKAEDFEELVILGNIACIARVVFIGSPLKS